MFYKGEIMKHFIDCVDVDFNTACPCGQLLKIETVEMAQRWAISTPNRKIGILCQSCLKKKNASRNYAGNIKELFFKLLMVQEAIDNDDETSAREFYQEQKEEKSLSEKSLGVVAKVIDGQLTVNQVEGTKRSLITWANGQPYRGGLI